MIKLLKFLYDWFKIVKNINHLNLKMKTGGKQINVTSRIFSSSFIGVGLFSEDGYCLKANESLCQMLSKSEAELRLIDFYSLIHPDDLKVAPIRVAHDKNGMISQMECEVRFFIKNGLSSWFLAIFNTITEEKKSKFLLQLIDINTIMSTKKKH